MRSLVLLALLLGAQDKPDEIRLLVRADDMGVALGVNDACIKACEEGIARSVEVIVPGPWFLDAVERLKQKPAIDVGIHLCLTSEWERVKWRPLTHAPSLVDKDGYFYPMTRQRKDFPPSTGFLEAKPDLAEVERELRAQIELIKRHLPRLSHASAHMGTATATPELRALTEKLLKEYGLRNETGPLKRVPWRGGPDKTAAQREADLIAALEKLDGGTWILVEHPGLDTDEMRAMGHIGYTHVAADRAAVTQALTSAKVKDVVRSRAIKLIAYPDLR